MKKPLYLHFKYCGIHSDFKERDPYGKSLKDPGSKADAGKPPITRGLLDYFPRGCLEVSKVSSKGAEKYSWKGWESVPDGVNRYLDAAGRHMVYRGIDGEFDKDTGLLHLAQLAWNSLAALELYLREQERNETMLKPGEWKEVSSDFFGKR